MAAYGEEGSVDIKQAKQVQIGDSVPTDFDFLVLDKDASTPRQVKMSDIVRGKRVVLFGLPGAFTSVCSSKHVPQYNSKLPDLQAKGVDTVACLSVNDPWVMREWAQHLGVDPSKVLMLADGEGKWHGKMGLLQHLPGLGLRARRYSMLVEDGAIKVLNVEEPGGLSYKVSGPDHMLHDIETLAGATKA